jgi:outer membrane protein
MRKRFPFMIAAAVLLILAGPASAEQLTTVGVIDIARVAGVFFRDSSSLRELEDMTAKVQAELDAVTREINLLREKRLTAERAGNRSDILRIDDEIGAKTSYIKDYYRIKSAQIQERRAKLTESSAFLTEIQKAIAFVAEEQGYNIILKNSDPSMIWWSKQIDITERVIEYLSKNTTSR